MSVLQNEVLELTVNELAVLSVCLEVPQPAGLGVRPLDSLSDADRTQLILLSLQSLATKGYVEALPDDRFRVLPVAAQLVTVAARPSAVLRLARWEGDQATGVVFIYGIRDLAVLHEIRPDGSHRLLPKSLAEALGELADVLGGLPLDADLADAPLVLTRAQLGPEPSSADGPEPDPRVVSLRADLARAVESARLDLAWINRAGTVAPYLAVFTSDAETSWLLTGIGEEPDDLVTCHPAKVAYLRRALQAMLVGSAFEMAGSAA
jgi:hypothetical protein